IEEGGYSALYTSEDPELLFTTAMNGIVLGHEGVEQIGNASELYLTPANLHVASLLGTYTLTEAFYRDEQHLNSPLGTIRLERLRRGGTLKSRVELLLRPDAIVYDNRSIYHATVSINHFAGSERHYTLTAEGGLQLSVSTHHSIDIEVGKRFPFHIVTDHLLLVEGEDDTISDLGTATTRY
ncbi:MAG: TOBE domain-containing protein, partial [Gammaproteobacteria bacterium]|nr:TOBE domain-containing protein [Gammaproteobacteria bacterium]